MYILNRLVALDDDDLELVYTTYVHQVAHPLSCSTTYK